MASITDPTSTKRIKLEIKATPAALSRRQEAMWTVRARHGVPEIVVPADTEFISPNPVTGQILEFGVCLGESSTGKVIAEFSSPVLKVTKGKVWHPRTEEGFWKKPENKTNYERILKGTVTVEEGFNDTMEELYRQVAKYKAKVPGARFKWLVDHGSGDTSHLAYLLDTYKHEPLVYTFGDYADMFNVEMLEAACTQAMGYSESPSRRWKPASYPVVIETKAHHAQYDAVYMFERLWYYLNVLTDIEMGILPDAKHEATTAASSWSSFGKASDVIPESTEEEEVNKIPDVLDRLFVFVDPQGGSFAYPYYAVVTVGHCPADKKIYFVNWDRVAPSRTSLEDLVEKHVRIGLKKWTDKGARVHVYGDGKMVSVCAAETSKFCTAATPVAIDGEYKQVAKAGILAAEANGSFNGGGSRLDPKLPQSFYSTAIAHQLAVSFINGMTPGLVD